MPMSETPERVIAPGFGLSWGPVIAGAIAASALAFVLDSFGLALGLALSSASPTWRDTSFALVLLSRLYLVLVALASYGLGGYPSSHSGMDPTDRAYLAKLVAADTG